MSERKVQNKYYPPNFDPTLIVRVKKPKPQLHPVNMMLPMSIRCLVCGEYMPAGKKFNSKKETVIGEKYITIPIYRFYMKCTGCHVEFTIKTDPQNADYVAERNCKRNFEKVLETRQMEQDELAKQKELESDIMKKLENRTLESKQELEDLEKLDELKFIRANQEKLRDALLNHNAAAGAGGDISNIASDLESYFNAFELDDEEEAMVKNLFDPNNRTNRLSDNDNDSDSDERQQFGKSLYNPNIGTDLFIDTNNNIDEENNHENQSAKLGEKPVASLLGMVEVKARRKRKIPRQQQQDGESTKPTAITANPDADADAGEASRSGSPVVGLVDY